jgi:multidrug efflux system outer membrane protein
MSRAPFFLGRVGALLALACLAACSHAPQLARYQPPAQAGFVNAPDKAVTDEPVAEFWRRFEDEQLSSLVQRALKANTDVRTAAASLAEARAAGRFATADMWTVMACQRPTAPIRSGWMCCGKWMSSAA